jgi:2-haloalkanoic acid dehalogenase type II
LQSVCFDLDGTLSYYPLSTLQVLRQALRRADVAEDRLGDLSLAADRYNELWLTLEQSSDSTESLRRVIMTKLFEEFGMADDDIAYRTANAYGDVRRETGVLPYPGIERLLDDLKPHYRLGLLTNGPSDMQWDKIRTLGLESRFDAIIVAGDVGIYKPDVRVFDLLLSRLDSTAERTLFVGDSYSADIAGAHEAGMHAAWIVRDPPEVEPDTQPALVRGNVCELREVLL